MPVRHPMWRAGTRKKFREPPRCGANYGGKLPQKLVLYQRKRQRGMRESELGTPTIRNCGNRSWDTHRNGRSWDTHDPKLRIRIRVRDTRSWDTHDPKLRIRIRVRDTHAQQARVKTGTIVGHPCIHARHARVKTALKGLNRVAQGNALGLPPQ